MKTKITYVLITLVTFLCVAELIHIGPAYDEEKVGEPYAVQTVYTETISAVDYID